MAHFLHTDRKVNITQVSCVRATTLPKDSVKVLVHFCIFHLVFPSAQVLIKGFRIVKHGIDVLQIGAELPARNVLIELWTDRRDSNVVALDKIVCPQSIHTDLPKRTDLALENMPSMLVAETGDHAEISLLKDSARANMRYMFRQLRTNQPEISPLNFEA